MSFSLSAERDRIQRQVDELQQRLSVSQNELDLLSSETDDVSDSEDEQDEVGKCEADLLAQKEKIQTAIQNLEDILGPHSPLSVSSRDSDQSDLSLSESVDSCLQVNLVYQQVIQETLDHLETLLTHNQTQQRDIVSQICGPVKEESRGRLSSSLQHPAKMFLGSFLKPYFKDKLTGLGPPANQEARLKAQRMAGCPDDKKLRVKRWESWQKTLLIHSVSRDSMKRLIQPKLSRVDYLTQKVSSVGEADQLQLRLQIEGLETEMDLLRQKKEEELIGGRYEEHDWQKISNIDFEGTKEAEDIRLFWQNFLHPSINKTMWSKEEVQQLKDVSRRHQETNWERITEQLGTGRTAFMCLQMFQRFVTDSLKRGSWTPEEDAQLRELVDKMRIGNFIPYTQMSYFMEGRDPAQLIYRWNQVLDPILKKGPWTREEDQLLLRAVSRYGEKCWWRIRLEVPGRTDSSCRDRYLDSLKKGLKRGAFDRHERELLKNLVEKYGVGHWAKIAAEIPHRLDAQCMREWRKLTRPFQPHDRKRKKPCRRGGGRTRKKAGASAKRRVRRIVKIKKEEEEEEEEEEKEMTEEEEEEEDMVVQYMDSDEDTKKKKRKLVKETVEVEEEEEEYVIPPMKEWLPAEEPRSVPSLTFRPAVLSSQDEKLVRSTILRKSGRSVVLGPPPRELRWEERHSCATMMMVSCDQLRTHLSLTKSGSLPRQEGGTPVPQTRSVDRTERELQAAITPWIGNLLIANSRRRTASDVLREHIERSSTSTSSVFLLLLQVMDVDIIGCREMIQQKNNKVVHLAPPPDPSPFRIKDQRSVAGLLQRGRERQQEDEQRRQILQQLQEAQQERLRKRPKPHLLIQGPRHMTPQMVPLPLPASQSTIASIQFAPPPLQNIPPPLPAPPSSQVLVPILIPLAPPPPQATPIGTTGTSDHTVLASSSSTLTPPIGKEQRTGVGGAQEARVTSFQDAVMGSSDPTQETCFAPPPPHLGTLCLATPTSTVASDHNYTTCTVGPAPKDSRKTIKSKGRKRKREGGVAYADMTQEGKRLRKPSQKAREAKSQTDAKKKRSSASSAQHRSCLKDVVCAQAPPLSQAPPLHQAARLDSLCNQTMWVMTPAGLVPLVPPQHTKLVSISSSSLPVPLAPPPLSAESLRLEPVTIPLNAINNQPCPFSATLMPPSAFERSHDPNLSPSHLPTPTVLLPYKGVVRVDSVKAPPLRREGLQFDPALMFLEHPDKVRDWLSGLGGVAVPGAKSALPYLPPFVSTLSALSLLLRAKKSLMTSSLQLLSGDDHPGSAQSAADLLESTSDLRPAEEQTAPSVSYSQVVEEEEEEEQVEVEVVRQLVAERFSSNPAYQLLKARFLSCFTVPALLATIQPITKEKSLRPTNEEQDDGEDDDQLTKIHERGRRGRAKRSQLLSDDASANHISGISVTNEPDPDPQPVPQNQSPESGPDQNIREQKNHLFSSGPSGSATGRS